MNIHEAAERLRRTDIGDHLYRHNHDKALLASEMLKLTDPAPITAEALRELGFDVDAGCWQFKCDSLDVVAYLESCNKAFVNGRGVDGIKSIGQLRAQLFALKGSI